MRLYLASPLGFSDAGRLFKDKKLKPGLRRLGFQVIDPWTLTSKAELAGILNLPYGIRRKKAWERFNKVIGNRNRDAIDHSNFVVAVLDGQDVDSGTAD